VLAAVAFCPHPPLLVPEVAAGAAQETAPLRAAALDALRRVLAVERDVLVVIGPGQPWSGAGGVGSFRNFGIAVDVPIGVAADVDAAPRLALPLAVGAWLLEQVPAPAGPVETVTVDAASASEIGTALASRRERVVLLAMADGSARRSDKAPGHFDPAAAAFDAGLESALAAGDPGALAAVSSEAADAQLATGWPVWQAVAAAAAGADWRATLLYADAPYGVGYAVATWQRA
jgi:hypothetical protein